jgi:hypothetical protein
VHDAGAGELGVLLVQGDRAAAEALVLQCAPQQASAADRQAVVAEAESAGIAQRGHLGQLLPLHRSSHGGEETDPDRGRRAGIRPQRLDVGGGGDGRFGVGHRQGAAIATGRGRAGAGLDVLLVLLARGAQVHVGVEEGREGVQAAGVDFLEAVDARRAGRGQLGDLAGADHQVVLGIDPGNRVEHRGAPQDYVRALAGADLQLSGAHAGCPIGVACAAPLAPAGAGSSPFAASSS